MEATATVITFIGESILADKCGRLAEKAGAVEKAAEDAGVDCADLERAARRLMQAASADERLLAVVGLRDASAALEGSARAPIDALRGAAASLARSCREYQETAEGVEKMKRAIEVENPETGWGARSWWWPFGWRGCRRQRGLGEPLLDADVESGMRLAVEFVGRGAPEQLRKRHANLLALAHQLIAAANGARVPYRDLASATTAFQAGNAAARLDLVVNLGTAATAMETAESDLLDVLRGRAANLAHACGALKKAADAMAGVQRTAEELRKRRVAGSWWSRFWRRRGHPIEEEPQDGAAAVQPVLDKVRLFLQRVAHGTV